MPRTKEEREALVKGLPCDICGATPAPILNSLGRYCPACAALPIASDPESKPVNPDQLKLPF